MTSVAPSQHLYSLDALRGFDMFWIMGAEEIVNSLEFTGSPFLENDSCRTHAFWVEWFSFLRFDIPFIFIHGRCCNALLH